MLPRVIALVACSVVPLCAQEPAPPPRLSLGDAVARGAAQAAPVELAELRAVAARALVRQSRAALLPSVSASAGWVDRTFNRRSLGFDIPVAPGTQAPPDLVGPFAVVDARLRFTQPLFDRAGMLRVRAARAGVEGADAEQAMVAEASAQRAAVAYLGVARADAVVDARQADSALAAELLGLAQAQLAVGAATALDVTRARTQLVEAREGLVVATSRAARARVELERALGLTPDGAPVAVDPLGDQTAAEGLPQTRAEGVARAQRERPDLAAEAARVDAAGRSAAAIGAERLPRLELSGDYGLNGPTAPDAIATRQLALQVTVPLLDGFRREGRLDEQRAALRSAEVRLADLERQVTAEVTVALLDVQAAQAQQAIAQERLALATQEVTQARDRFTIGTAGNIELIDAQLALLRARDADIEARYGGAVARVALAHAVGGSRAVR